MEEEKEELLKRPKHPVVFINHVDTYVGKNISKVVASSIVGANLDATDNESQTSAQAGETKENFYRVVGTLLDPVKNQKPAWVEEIFEYSKKEELLKHILQSDIIIYDIISRPDQVDEATWVVSALHAEIENFVSPKIFICLSSIMTWARTKPLDPDEPEIPFTEDDYRRRRAHPNFRPHISTEKLVIKLGKTSKTKLLTYVITSGLMYGESEEIFHSLFKSAWHCQYPLQCYGNGQNIVPMIHITDLSNVLVNVCDSQPKVRYLIAKDDSQSPLEEIVKCVSAHLGTGKVKHVTKEQALLIKDLQQTDFDMLLVNLRMDAGYIREGMNIAWKAETGLIDNIESVIQEYKKTRELQPIRACVLGAPSTGKTLVVKQLCQLYKLHHIAIQDVINEAIGQLEQSAARADADGDDEDDVKAEEDRELMEALIENKEQNNGRYNDNYIIRFYKNKLHSMPCQNQGFILDGYPKTYEVARELFAADDVDDEDEGGSVLQYSKLIMPEVVVSLDATDDFLKARVMNLPESVVAGTHNTEEGLLRRLAEFRAVNTEDETVLNYFDELEIHPDHIDVSQDSSPEMLQTVERIKKLLGEPRNYGPTPEELIEIQRIDAERKLERERKDKEDRIRKEAEEATERTRKEEEWRIRLNEVKKEEEEVLETQSIPLRNYLMKHVMPTLSQGLVECTKVRPDDPVDFLAEYLFKNNPQID